MNEDNIIKGCIEGSSEAQAALYKRWRWYLYLVAFRVVKNKMDAEDILQVSFLKIFRGIDTYTQGKSFKGWMAAIVKNTALSHFALNKKHNTYEMLEGIEPMQKRAPNFIDAFIAGDSYQQAMRLLHEKAPGQYMYVRLHLEEDMNYKEISEDLLVNEGVIKSQISRGCSKLRQIIREFEDPYKALKDRA